MADTFKLAQDGKGNFKKDLGWKQVQTGKYVQHRFYLGRDRAQAVLRSVRLDAVWEAVIKRWQRDKKTERPCWDSTALAIAGAVARGEEVADLDPPAAAVEEANHLPPGGLSDYHGGLAAVTWLGKLQEDFPTIRLRLADQRQQESGEQVLRDFSAASRHHADKLDRLCGHSVQTLHGALDAFGEALKEKYRTAGGEQPTLYGEALLRQLSNIKHHSTDVALAAFNLQAIESLIACWANRPVTKRGRPCSVKHASNVIKVIRLFIRWLHRSSAFKWRKPDDYEVTPVRIRRTHNDALKLSPAQVQTWTLDELGELWQYACPMDRLYLLLALNCGFGIAEISSLRLTEIFLGDDSFIKRVRFKSGVYGEWKLWNETVQAINWMKAHRPSSALPELILNREGKPIHLPTTGNRPNRTIANAWGRLLTRIRKDKSEFRELSFNKLRKTAGNEIRKIAGGEIASVFLSHGQAVGDSLLEVYTNRDFGKAFEACDALAIRLRPLWSAVTDPFPTARTQPKVSLGTIRKIKEMRAGGYKVAFIAKTLGVSTETVRRHGKQGQRGVDGEGPKQVQS